MRSHFAILVIMHEGNFTIELTIIFKQNVTLFLDLSVNMIEIHVELYNSAAINLALECKH